MPSFQLKYRNHSPEVMRTRPIQRQCYACMEYNYEWFVNDLENPYSTPADRPFTWQRLRVLGGRSLVWGRQSYRLSDVDFKAASRDGYDVDWPFSYTDLLPFYDIVENYVGISGAAEKNEMLPDGQFLPAMKMSCGEMRLRDSVQKNFGRTLTIGRTAIVTQPHNGRAPCHYCGPCERGCMTYSYFSSPFTTVKDALKTGNCTLITDAIVSHVDMNTSSNKAQGVTFVHRTTRETKQVRAKTVVSVRTGARINAHPAEFRDARLCHWPGQFQRIARALFNGSCSRWRCQRDVRGFENPTKRESTASSEWSLPGALSQYAERRETSPFASWLWVSGWLHARIQHGCPRYRR